MNKFLLALLGLLVPVTFIGILLPTEYTIARSITIEAAPEQVHALVGDLTRWDEWTPWIEKDPTIVTILGAKTTGVGASQTWTGEQGDGELTFTKSDPATGITYDMTFVVDKRKAPSTAAVTYRVEGDSTLVSWIMEGDIAEMAPPVVSGYMGLLMDNMISSDFETGLTKLKDKVEAGD